MGEEEIKEEEEDAGLGAETPSELYLQYNTIRGYVSAVLELYNRQVSARVNCAPCPTGVALKALKSSVSRSEFRRRRSEYVDRGVDNMKDGYIAAQVPDVAAAVFGWKKEKSIEAALRTWVDFLLGHSMLMRLGNRLMLELPDLLMMSLPREGPPSSSCEAWCLVA